MKKDASAQLVQAITEQMWAHAINLANAYPEDVKKRFSVTVERAPSRVYSLHWACTKNPTKEIITTLLRHFPEAIEKTDSAFNRLPLHYACCNGAHESVVRVLLEQFPAAANKTALNGRLPIHYATANGASAEVLAALIEHNPQGPRVADKRGMLPLHLACLQNASPQVILVLLKAFPEGVYFKTEKGNSPKSCLKTIPDSPNKKTVIALLDVSTKKCSRFHAAINSSVRGGKNQFRRYKKMLTAVDSAEFC